MKLQSYRDEKTGRWFLSGVEPEEKTYERILDDLKSYKNFKFARYGDGEIYCMNGKVGMNCDKHIYFPDMGKKLRESLEGRPEYMIGIQPLSVSHLPELVTKYFNCFDALYNADVLHSASIDGQLGRFFTALEGRYIILVGPGHLSSLFDGSVHIIIPSINCWMEYESIKEQIEFHLIKDCVVLFCASMMSEVLISDFKDYDCTMIDTGSLLDPYVGVKSRRYHNALNVI